MQLSEELARTFTAMSRLLREREGELSRSDVGVLVRLAGQECTRPRAWPGPRGWTPRR
ncbi:hypothetical protein [Serinicoccus marinus]|uniref:hypothetical protein n=1 Tax=Serinicoccus marinus TaxID=247333 RepID=UPI0013754698|nr:hypothetical protein [Serinicoccus marinus]